LRPHGRATFVDRADAMEALAGAIEASRAGQRQAVFITGEPGIGKTRLVSEVAAKAHADGAVVLAGRCDEDLALAYQPVAEALEHLVAYTPEEQLRRHVDAFGGRVARIAPSLAFRIGMDIDAAPPATDSDRYAMFAAIEELLALGAGDNPLLIVFEDLHWADQPTLLLLKRLLTSPRGTPATFLCTTRLDPLDEDHPMTQLLAAMHREPGTTRIDLEGLHQNGVAALLSQLLDGSEQDGRIAAALHEGTGGNPFFVTELLQSLTEARGLDASPAAPDAVEAFPFAAAIPGSVTDTVLARVRRLGPTAARCLTVAAVAGDEFDLELLVAVAEIGGVAEALDGAVRAGLLIETPADGPRFRFVHALVRRALYAELGAARRAELHRSVALALERRLLTGSVSAAELARHWLGAGVAGSGEKAYRYSILAGDEARAKLAPDTARRWYEVALGRLPDGAPDADRCELLLRRGEVERQAGRAEFRATLLEAAVAARADADLERLVRAALLNTRGLQSSTGERDDERIEVLEQALAATEPDSADRAMLYAILASELTFAERERSIELSDEALATARRAGDQAAQVFVLNLRFLATWMPDTHAARMAETAAALKLCEGIGDPLEQFHAHHWRGAACIEAGELAEARSCLELERRLAERLRQPTAMWLAAGDRANLALIEGRLDDAERGAASAFEIGLATEPDALACYTAQLVPIMHTRGRLGDLLPAVEQAVNDNPGIPGFRATLALAYCDAGRREDAAGVLADACDRRFGDLIRDVTWLAAVCIYAEAAGVVGDAASAAVLRELLLPWRDLVAYPGWGAWAPVSHYLGMLALTCGDLEEAAELLGHARALAARAGAPAWRAATEVQTARLAHARGEQAAADSTLAAAIAAARELGADGIAAYAKAVQLEWRRE
jgi:hypothetical protein